MATKTWKLGEYSKGGVITAEVKGDNVAVIAKDWDFTAGSNKGSNQSNAKEFDRIEVNIMYPGAYRELENYLNDLTSIYYADKILNWIKSK